MGLGKPGRLGVDQPTITVELGPAPDAYTHCSPVAALSKTAGRSALDEGGLFFCAKRRPGRPPGSAKTPGASQVRRCTTGGSISLVGHGRPQARCLICLCIPSPRRGSGNPSGIGSVERNFGASLRRITVFPTGRACPRNV